MKIYTKCNTIFCSYLKNCAHHKCTGIKKWLCFPLFLCWIKQFEIASLPGRVHWDKGTNYSSSKETLGGSAWPDCVGAQQAVMVKQHITSRELSFMTRKEKKKKKKIKQNLQIRYCLVLCWCWASNQALTLIHLMEVILFCLINHQTFNPFCDALDLRYSLDYRRSPQTPQTPIEGYEGGDLTSLTTYVSLLAQSIHWVLNKAKLGQTLQNLAKLG